MKTLRTIVSVFSIFTVFAFAASAQTSLPSLDGAKVDVQAQRGKVVILAVGTTWTPRLSDKQAEFTNMLAKKYAGKNVVIYFVATDSANPKSKNFAADADVRKFKANKLNVTLLRDSDGAATVKKFGIDQFPSFVLLDKDGRQSGEPFGGIDPKFDITVPISKAVDRLL